jgi:Fe-S cluster assembly ATPase SufC
MELFEFGKNSPLDVFDSAFYVSGPDGFDVNKALDSIEHNMELMKSGLFEYDALSNGQQSMLCGSHTIAQIENLKPKRPLVLIDELDSGLSFVNTPIVRGMVFHMITKLNATVLMATHNPFVMQLMETAYDMENDMKSVLVFDYIGKLTGYTLTHYKP